jgi:galactonate dehydratase
VPWFSDVCNHPIVMKDGYWDIPQGPGFGVEINEKEAAKHPFEPEKIPALDAVLGDGTIANW